MLEEKKVRSLVSLLDDNDSEIFGTIRQEIIKQGDGIIPILEEFWEKRGLDPLFQERVEHIIHEIQFQDIEARISLCKSNENALLEGLYAISKYQYPDIQFEDIKNQIDAFALTLENNIYPNARIKDKLAIINEFFFDKWGFRGNKQNLGSPQNSFISDVMNTRKANPLLLCSIYLMLCEKMRLPVVPVNFPRYFVLGVYNPDSAPTDFPDYFLDIFGKGTVLSEFDLRKFLNTINLEFEAEYIMPCTTLDIIKRCLNNLHHSYHVMGYKEKKSEIQHLRNLLED